LKLQTLFAAAIIRLRKPSGEESVAEKTILLVEDDEDQVILAMRALRKHGIVAEVDDVVVSGSGEVALDYMFGTGAYEGRDASSTPEFVLLDVNLPKLGGHQVLERLRGDSRTRLRHPLLLPERAQGRREGLRARRQLLRDEAGQLRQVLRSDAVPRVVLDQL